MIDAATHAACARRRSQGYWLLSCFFLDTPRHQWLRPWRESLSDETSEGTKDSSSRLREVLDAALADVTAAAVAHTRYLCLGDKEGAESLPFEAHVREGRLPGETTQQVIDLCAEAGYEDAAPQAASPDHLGAELRFMALLCHDESQAWVAGDSSGAMKCLDLQRRLMAEHLSKWVPTYCTGLAQRAGNAYVQALGRLTASWTCDDGMLLDEVCATHGQEALA